MRNIREPGLLVAPGLLILLFAFFLPVGQVLYLSFVGDGPDGSNVFTLSHYLRFVEDTYYVGVIWRTLRLSFLITAICIALGFPLAYLTSRIAPRYRIWLMALVVLPLMTSVVIRTFGWVVVLGRGGLIADLLQWLGLADRNFRLLFTETGIVVALVQVLLPFMTLTILGVLLRVDPRLEEAARTSGAGFFATLRTVVFPLSMPGIISGSMLVFTLSASSFITPNLVGGARLPVLASSVYQQATSTLDWSFAAAQATILLVIVLAIIFPYLAFLRRGV